ncbi:MAG: SMP-30/gluconolactonase/LRE family protein, partial [Flavisolibacter sp.]
MKKILTACSLFLLMTSHGQSNYKTVGMIERYDSSINQLLSPGAKAEIIAEGFSWSEGPLWMEKQKMLLFSDVPQNTIYKWTAAKGKEIYLKPSGYTSSVERGGEMGSNGLLLDREGHLVMCQHGDRRMARMISSTDHPQPNFVTLADK